MDIFKQQIRKGCRRKKRESDERMSRVILHISSPTVGKTSDEEGIKSQKD